MEGVAKVEQIFCIEDLDDDELLKAISKHPVATTTSFFDGLKKYKRVINYF